MFSFICIILVFDTVNHIKSEEEEEEEEKRESKREKERQTHEQLNSA